jgi:CheY-like chemotaxis protein
VSGHVKTDKQTGGDAEQERHGANRLVQDGPPPTALIVDDDAVLRVGLKRFLEKRGFLTRACTDGREAVRALQQAPADVVLLDAQMPNMDGFEACAAIRAMPHGERIPIIMITANEDEASVDRAFAVGANEYITKPVHWAVLGHRLRQLIAAARAEQALRERREREAKRAQARQDIALLETYATEKDIEEARKVALTSRQAMIERSRKRLETFAAERKKLDDEAEFYVNRKLPAKLEHAFEANDSLVQAEHRLIAEMEADLARINKRFDAEAQRYRELMSAGAKPLLRTSDGGTR